jgi:outer membrane protein assembly factor BamB
VRAAFAGFLAAFAVAAVVEAAQPQFWKLEGARDFLEGDTEGLSIDSEGRMRLAPAARALHDPDSPYVWSLIRDSKGGVYAGTGNDGKVFKIENGKGSVLFDAPELEVHALAVGPDGRLYVGSSPEGKVYAVDASGKSETFFDPSDKYIWALEFDAAGNLLVATGAEGRVHKVDRQGKSQVVLSTPDTHITALARDEGGNIYAGSAPSGIIYRIDPAGKVFVIHDSAFREVKALEVGPDRSLYAAVIDGRERDEAPRPALPPPMPASTPAPVAEVTVTESFSIPAAGPTPAPTPRAPEAARGGAPKGAVLRIAPSGEVDILWSSSDETPHSLLTTSNGVLVGTGNKGKLYRLSDDRTWTMVADFSVDQITALRAGAGGEILVAASNPGRIYSLEAQTGSRGTFTSKVKDTETVSTWGRVRWEASLPAGSEIQVQTRSGNTATPDTTWSAWSTPYARPEGEAITSEKARFLQVRVILGGKGGVSPVLDSVTAAYLQRNLRPQITQIQVHPPGEAFQKPLSISGDTEILGLDTAIPEGRPGQQPARSSQPPATSFSRKMYQKGIQTVSWRADDPNGDILVYDVYYRPVGDQRFRLLRKGLTDPVVAWDTTTVPNGRYLFKVRATDAPSNPDPLALSTEKESEPFEVDNTPPSVTATLVRASPLRVRVVARDDSSIIRKAEYSVDGGRWLEIHPLDGINDSIEETYEIPVAELGSPGPHLVVVRAMDLLGNVATARVEVP